MILASEQAIVVTEVHASVFLFTIIADLIHEQAVIDEVVPHADVPQ